MTEHLTSGQRAAAQPIARMSDIDTSGGLPKIVRKVLDKAAREFASATEQYRFEVLEFSPARIKWIHDNIGTVPSDTTPVWAWKSKTRGYNPAVKVILGIGPRFNFTSAPEIVDPGVPAIVVSAYGRLAYIMDTSLVHGNDTYLQHVGLVTNL
jgi:hypothetical protein